RSWAASSTSLCRHCAGRGGTLRRCALRHGRAFPRSANKSNAVRLLTLQGALIARPSTPLLSRQHIRDEALPLIDAERLESFSMRRLATSLGVSAPSLYSHDATREQALDDFVGLMITGGHQRVRRGVGRAAAALGTLLPRRHRCPPSRRSTGRVRHPAP